MTRTDLARRSASKLPLIGATILLHLAVYYTVNAINAGRPAADFFVVATVIDDSVPYVGWSSLIYYLGDAYIVLWGGYVVWQLDSIRFRAAIGAFAAIVVAGGAAQLAIPVEAPFPAELSPLQALVHEALAVRPYATFPSMHVALATLTAALSLNTVSSLAVRALSTAAAGAIALSTVTAREHFALDVVTGALLGLAGYGIWVSAVRRSEQRGGDPPTTKQVPFPTDA